MIKMDKFWIATASLIYPSIDKKTLVGLAQIREKYFELFSETLPQSLEQQLISWKPRYADKGNVTRGGSRKRYLFRTDNGSIPSARGGFRLYKVSDSVHDGEDKIGPAYPEMENVSGDFKFLVDWYSEKYQERFSNIEISSRPIYLGDIESGFSKQVDDANKLSHPERQKRLANAPKLPKRVTRLVYVFERNADVVAEVLQRAQGYCETCKTKAPFLRRSNGTAYLEVHHRKPLSEEGEDTVENALALCPNCHRQSHFG